MQLFGLAIAKLFCNYLSLSQYLFIIDFVNRISKFQSWVAFDVDGGFFTEAFDHLTDTDTSEVEEGIKCKVRVRLLIQI